MKTVVDRCIRQPSGRVLFIAVLVSFVANQAATAWLNLSQAASRLPVPYYVAQLSFSPDKLKGWYAQLLQFGTLDIYLHTQHIDFLFIASTLALHFAFLMWLSRMFRADSALRRWTVVAAMLSTIGPFADAAENLFCYAMLAQPLDFRPALAYLYSSCSTIKFAFFVVAYGACIAALLAALFQRAVALVHQRRPTGLV